MDGFLPLRSYSHLPETGGENPMSATRWLPHPTNSCLLVAALTLLPHHGRKSGSRSKSTAPPPLTGAPKVPNPHSHTSALADSCLYNRSNFGI